MQPSARKGARLTAATGNGSLEGAPSAIPEEDDDEVDLATEIFVRGFSAVKSQTHPHLAERVEGVWVLRDGQRNNPRNYRKEEWIVRRLAPSRADQIARRHTRGRFFVCDMLGMEDDGEVRKNLFKSLDYRPLATEVLFLHDLSRIPRCSSIATIRRVTDSELAGRLARITRSRPLEPFYFTPDSLFRQYVALIDDVIVGWVRSVWTECGNWVSDMKVVPEHRRKGVGTALMVRMLRDDRQLGVERSGLLSTQAGTRLYQRAGYRQIGRLQMFVPRRAHGD